MKKIYLPILACLFLSSSYAQEDYLEEIAKKPCECIGAKDFSAYKNKETRDMQLGICLLEAAKDHKDKLLQEHDLNLDNFQANAERFGEVIGLRMALICPNTLMAVSGELESDTPEVLRITGEVREVVESPFVTFTIKDSDGRSSRFYWLDFVSSTYPLQSQYMDLNGKTVKVEYVSRELFDPRIREYRNFNVITAVEVAEGGI